MTTPIKCVKKDRLFFDRFEFCLSFHMKELHVCRSAEHTRVDSWLNARMNWFNDQRNKNFGGSWDVYMDSQASLETVENIRYNCHELVDFLLKHKDQHKLVISVNWGWFYTSDLKMIQELSKFNFITVLCQTNAVVTMPRGSIRLVNSPHKFRSYFRSKRLTENQRENLINFVANNPEVHVSPSFRTWLDRKWSTWMRDSYFIDYDSEYIRTMLELTCAGAIRKTLNIVNDK